MSSKIISKIKLGIVMVAFALAAPAVVHGQSFGAPCGPSGAGIFPDAVDSSGFDGFADIGQAGIGAYTGSARSLGGYARPYGGYGGYGYGGYGYGGGYGRGYTTRYNNYLSSVNYANQTYAYNYGNYTNAYSNYVNSYYQNSYSYPGYGYSSYYY
jgi:hypothetical protein